jgi:hypothetical protein
VKQLGVHPASARGDPPVDAADIVAWLVGPYFCEFQAPPAEA